MRDLVDGCAFDTIYHEHFSYFSCTAIAALARRHGLFLNRVERFPEVQGGSLRWHLGSRDEPESSAADFLRSEQESGVTDFGYYSSFGARVEQVQRDLLALLRSLRAEGRTIAAYGAAAKGTILLNSAGVDSSLVDFVVDRNPHKVGLFMPGVHLPVYPVERLLEASPTTCSCSRGTTPTRSSASRLSIEGVAAASSSLSRRRASYERPSPDCTAAPRAGRTSSSRSPPRTAFPSTVAVYSPGVRTRSRSRWARCDSPSAARAASSPTPPTTPRSRTTRRATRRPRASRRASGSSPKRSPTG